MEYLGAVVRDDEGRYHVPGIGDPGGPSWNSRLVTGFVAYSNVSCWERIKGWVLEHIFHMATTIKIKATGEKIRVKCSSFGSYYERVSGNDSQGQQAFTREWIQKAVAEVRRIENANPMPSILDPKGGVLKIWQRQSIEKLIRFMKRGEFKDLVTNFIKCCKDEKIGGIVMHGLEFEEIPKEQDCYFFEGKLGIHERLINDFNWKDEKRKEIESLVAEQMKKAVESVQN